jgi:ribosomal protein S18 acetylase RimI-like enzyme
MHLSKVEHKKRINLKKRRIRAFFLSIETKKKHKEEIDEASEDLYKDGMVYLQMKLPVGEITNEFEDKLIKSIEHNVIKAKIRDATKSDLDTLKNIYNRSWLTSNTPFRAITKTDLQKILEDPNTIFLIARVYGVDAAFVLLDFEGPNNEYAVIAALAVLPRFQRKGVGTALGMASWRYFKERYPNVMELRCEVYLANQVSYSFIKGLGFEEFERKVYRMEDFEIADD